MRHPSNAAWAALGAGILAYDYICPSGETLSEGVDRYLQRFPNITACAVGAVALHLLNVLPPQIDVLHQLGARFKHE